jgi:hypothetical protein
MKVKETNCRRKRLRCRWEQQVIKDAAHMREQYARKVRKTSGTNREAWLLKDPHKGVMSVAV